MDVGGSGSQGVDESVSQGVRESVQCLSVRVEAQ